MRSSTETVTAPWLIREMAPRIASTLNYFLLHLTGQHMSYLLWVVPVLCTASGCNSQVGTYHQLPSYVLVSILQRESLMCVDRQEHN